MRSDGRIIAVLFLLVSACAPLPPVSRPGVIVPILPPSQPVEQLLANLHSSVAITRAGAAWQLAGVAAPGEEVRNALDATLDDPDEKVREAAAWALGHAKPEGTSSYDEMPRPVRISRPQYPRAAFYKHLEGTVDVEILIDAGGKIVHAEVRRSIPGLDQAALACVKTWSFEPARRKGRPAPIFAHAPVTFRID